MKKYQIIGAVLCAMGIVFASGETISNGITACVCMTVGYLSMRYGAAQTETSTQARKRFKRANAA